MSCHICSIVPWARTLEPGQDVAAALWGLCQRFVMSHPVEVARAGFEGPNAGSDMFRALCNSPSGVVISIADHADSFTKLPKPENKDSTAYWHAFA